MRVAIVLVLAGCGGTAHPADKPKRAPYMALFERGKTWTLPIEISDGHHDRATGAWIADQAQKSTLVCHTTEVRPLGAGTLARLACDKGDLLASGYWVATKSGLFHPPSEPSADDIATYQTGEPLIERVPEPRAETDDVEEASAGSSAFEFEGSWCVREAAAAELDRRDYTLCFDGKGISGGGELVIVGPDQTWHRVKFGKAPRDPDDPTEKR